MTTKDNFLLEKPKIGFGETLNNKYRNLNLNHNYQRLHGENVQSKNAINNSRKNENYDFTDSVNLQAKKESSSWNKFNKHLSSNYLNLYQETEKQHEFKRSKSATNSTLSLHIAAYENSVEADASDFNNGKIEDLKSKNKKTILSKKVEALKQSFVGCSAFIQNPFEFPRQQEDDQSKHPEVLHFKASQRLHNPNKEYSTINERVNTIPSNSVQSNEATTTVDILQQQQQSDHREIRTTTKFGAGSSNNQLLEDQNLIQEKSYSDLLCSPRLIQRFSQMYTHPKPLESIVLPLGFQGKNIFVQAKDGSGKTRCISALAANIVHETHSINIAVIIVAPNAENVYKIRDVFESLVSELPILAFGGEIDEDTKPLIGQWYPVIIAVPEMLSGLIRDEMISMESVSLVIISNADLFSDSVIQNDIQLLINSLMLSAIQLCIFSNGDAKNIYDFFGEYVLEPCWIQFGMEEHAVTPQVTADCGKVVFENGAFVGGDATQGVENGPKIVEKKHVRFNDIVETKEITATEKSDGDSHNIELEKCAPDIAAEDLSPSNSSKVFDYAVIEIGRHPSSVIKDLLTNINFNQVVIFANDCEMCLSICETLAECTYKVGMISSNMALSEMDNITEEFAIQNLQVLVSKDVSICDESVSKNVNLVISVGLPEDELAYFGRINQIHGASLIIISNLLDYQSLVFDFCNSEMDVRSVRSDDIPDNLTVNKAFFDNSNKVNENYNNFILSYQAPATAPALVNRDAAVPAISLDTVPGVPTARTVHVPIVASPTVPAAAVAPTLPGPTKTIPNRREIQTPLIQFLDASKNRNSTNSRRIFDT